MDVATALWPGLYFTRAAPGGEPSPLRSDVAGFVGRARRGPIGVPVRVHGWTDCQRCFGGLDADADLPYALRGYFENGGEVAHVVRVGKDETARSAALDLLHVSWRVAPDADPSAPRPPAASFRHASYRAVAASPGAWANRTVVRARYLRSGPSGSSELDLAIEATGEAPEYLSGLVLGEPDDGRDPLQRQVASRSALIRLVPAGSPATNANRGPARQDSDHVLDQGSNVPADASDYRAALRLLLDEPEVALLSLPDLYRDLHDLDARPLLAELLVQVDAGRDRILLLDAPRASRGGAVVDSAGLLDWLTALRVEPRDVEWRSAAAYHPWLSVPDPLGGVLDPLRPLPPSGHVAGVISRLDRERGAHYTPANAPLLDAVDLAVRPNADEQARLLGGAVNLLRCRAGEGLQVWGGSTLARPPRSDPARETFEPAHFVACRRLIHRLVRAIRRVAEPLVFDSNGPQLWLSFVRAVTTVLLEAYRGGALQGSRPEEAFTVRCDDKTNPPEERDLGRCVCEIGVAMVAPMEFIVFRVALGGESALEVFES